MITLTNTQVADLTLAAVAKKGKDYVYTDPVTGGKAGEGNVDCLYVYDGKPQCLVGQVLADAGIDVDHMDMEAPAYDLLDTLRSHGILKIDEDAEEFFIMAQGRQDVGIPWGEAITEDGPFPFIDKYATKEA